MKRLVPLVLIADDHPIVREGLVSAINQEPGLQVVAEASSWPEGIQGIIVHRPELAILDLRMPGMKAAHGIIAIHEKSPATKIIVLTSFGETKTFSKPFTQGRRTICPRKPVKKHCANVFVPFERTKVDALELCVKTGEADAGHDPS
jgi:DNA-binding NarL/FixJ family response regulator